MLDLTRVTVAAGNGGNIAWFVTVPGDMILRSIFYLELSRNSWLGGFDLPTVTAGSGGTGLRTVLSKVPHC